MFGGRSGEDLADVAISSRDADASLAEALGRPGPRGDGTSAAYLAALAVGPD